MQLRSISIGLITVALTLAHLAGPASACDPTTFDTPYDLHDQAATVVLVKVKTIAGSTVTLTRLEAFKGSPAATITLEADLKSTCRSAIKKGARGVIYLNASGHMLGLYNGFQADPAVIDALRAYSSGATAADRAAALLAVAVSRDWTRSYEAAYALANRIELVLALDTDARDSVIRRLAKVGQQSTLILVGARLHDPRVTPIQKRRRFEDGAALAGVLAGRFDSERDPVRLADAIAATATSASDRIAAMERCEQVRGISLARFTDYTAPSDDDTTAAWTARAEACRSGTPVP